MTEELVILPESLSDFEKRSLTFLGRTKDVYVAGEGPAVIVMSEMPGIYQLVADFARTVRDAGFTYSTYIIASLLQTPLEHTLECSQ